MGIDAYRIICYFPIISPSKDVLFVSLLAVLVVPINHDSQFSFLNVQEDFSAAKERKGSML